MDNVPFQFCQSVCSHKVHLIEREEKKDFSPSTFNFDSFPWNVAFQEHFERRSLGHLSIVADSEILFYVQTDELSLENPTRNGLEDAHFDNHFQISSIEIRYEKDLIPEEEQEKEISEILAYLGPYMNNVELLSIGQFTHRILKTFQAGHLTTRRSTA
ncbi:hypothetical protein QR680_013806 [Steinernema hermaphroditum]|uniref:Uncharacterized protein n=1 Tax=Steinernema hermaphroditum TaxID=289476 RepID=A0AA39M355_9BILA|nr:hypothetical protein QR680_013806 [Steinernema hermaphroditum]